MMTIRMTVVMILLTLSLPTKSENIGFLLSASDSQNTALKNMANYALTDYPEMTLLTEEYNNTLRSIIDACCRLVESNVSAVISKSSSSTTSLQADILSPLKIPLVSVSATDPTLPNLHREYLIRMSPSDAYQSRAVFDIIRYYQWTHVAVLASSDMYGVHLTMGLMDLEMTYLKDVEGNGFYINNIVFFQESDDIVNVTEKLTAMKDEPERVIVLNCAARYAAGIFETAYSLGMMGSGFVWIVTDTELAAEPEVLAINEVFSSFYEGLIAVRPALKENAQYNEFKDDYLLNNHTLDEITIYTLLTYDTVGLVSSVLADLTTSTPPDTMTCSSSAGWSDGNIVLSSLLNTNFTGVTGLINFTEEGESTRIAYDIVNFRDDQFQKVGTWTDTTGLEMTGSVLFLGNAEEPPSDQNASLVGKHLYLGAKIGAPFMYLSTENCEGNDCWTGYCMDIVTRLSEDLGFTYEFLQPEDDHWGGHNYNTTTDEWNGLVGDLISGRTDMIAVHLATSAARKMVIDFSYSFMDASTVAVVKGSSVSAGNIFFFFTTFDLDVWIGILAVNFLVTILVWLFSKLSPFGKHGAKMHAMQTCPCENCEGRRRQAKEKNCNLDAPEKFDCLIEEVEDDERSDDLSLFNSFWLVGTGLVAQAGETLPYCLSARFLLQSWWFFMLIIISLHSANLTAFLTLSNIQSSINDVPDLLYQDEYEWGLVDKDFTEDMLLTNVDTTYTTIAEKATLFKTLDEALEKLHEGKFVFIGESPIIEYYMKYDCDMVTIGEPFQPHEYSFGYPKNSPYSSLIDYKLLSYREEGYLDTLWTKWGGDSKFCSSTGNSLTFSMQMLSGVFYVLAIGVGMAAVLLLVELAYASLQDTIRYPKRRLSFCKAFARRIKLIVVPWKYVEYELRSTVVPMSPTAIQNLKRQNTF